MPLLVFLLVEPISQGSLSCFCLQTKVYCRLREFQLMISIRSVFVEPRFFEQGPFWISALRLGGVVIRNCSNSNDRRPVELQACATAPSGNSTLLSVSHCQLRPIDVGNNNSEHDRLALALKIMAEISMLVNRWERILLNLSKTREHGMKAKAETFTEICIPRRRLPKELQCAITKKVTKGSSGSAKRRRAGRQGEVGESGPREGVHASGG